MSVEKITLPVAGVGDREYLIDKFCGVEMSVGYDMAPTEMRVIFRSGKGIPASLYLKPDNLEHAIRIFRAIAKRVEEKKL